MVVIKQSFKAFLTKHKLDDAPAAARADDDDDYQQGKIESVGFRPFVDDARLIPSGADFRVSHLLLWGCFCYCL